MHYLNIIIKGKKNKLSSLKSSAKKDHSKNI